MHIHVYRSWWHNILKRCMSEYLLLHIRLQFFYAFLCGLVSNLHLIQFCKIYINLAKLRSILDFKEFLSRLFCGKYVRVALNMHILEMFHDILILFCVLSIHSVTSTMIDAPIWIWYNKQSLLTVWNNRLIYNMVHISYSWSGRTCHPQLVDTPAAPKLTRPRNPYCQNTRAASKTRAAQH